MGHQTYIISPGASKKKKNPELGGNTSNPQLQCDALYLLSLWEQGGGKQGGGEAR